MKNILAKPAESALASRAGAALVGAGKQRVLARSNPLAEVHAADERLTLAEKMGPLRTATHHLLGNVLQRGQRLGVAWVDYTRDRRKDLMISLDISVETNGERI